MRSCIETPGEKCPPISFVVALLGLDSAFGFAAFAGAA
jgi:hypothetical protein